MFYYHLFELLLVARPRNESAATTIFRARMIAALEAGRLSFPSVG
jgi:hypothetical protein